MKVRDILPKVKANRYTFKYLDEKDKAYFQNSYNYLKKNKDKELSKFTQVLIDNYLNNEDIDYIVKIRAIQFITTNI